MAVDRSPLSNAMQHWRVCVITDTALGRGRSHLQLAEAALAGGADVIQLRDKHAGGHELFTIAQAILERTRAAGSSFVVNDRVDVALAVGADGVHVGQDDLPAHAVRQLIGPQMLLGVSARTAEQARRAIPDGADYLGVGPIYDARFTKPDAAAPMGTQGLCSLRPECSVPILAIGGIDHGNAEEVMRAGADAVAVISCVVSADDVTAAVRDLRERVERASA